MGVEDCTLHHGLIDGWDGCRSGMASTTNHLCERHWGSSGINDLGAAKYENANGEKV